MQIFNLKDSLSSSDLKLLNEQNIDIDKIVDQYNKCTKGTIPTNLVRVATVNDGIKTLSDSEKNITVSFYNNNVKDLDVEKFVPASGAASRMFKFLTDFVSKYNPENESINSYINKYEAHELQTFIIGLDKFSFYNIVQQQCLKIFVNYNSLSSDHKILCFVKVMLDEKYLNFTNKPKGLITFHNPESEVYHTPVHKHIEEALGMSGNDPKIHFTVSDGFEKDFRDIISENENNITATFSTQMTSTNSVAFDLDNKFFRDNENQLLTRPGGHGSLIENLNQLNSDIVFIRNIDNVANRNLELIIFNKKVIGGILIKHQQIIFNILNKFDSVQKTENIIEILNYMEKDLNIFIPHKIKTNSSLNEIKDFVYNKLDRPIRVCGMVKNEGEAGGGPFWIKNDKGEISLQIIESAQIDVTNLSQRLILSQSTHFNPVDIVCGIKRHNGQKFDLTQYIDSNTGFIVHKTHEGRDLKAYELPGLWNGAMADWISIFVEVPIETFNPVKTVNDLLKEAHQPKK